MRSLNSRPNGAMSFPRFFPACWSILGSEASQFRWELSARPAKQLSPWRELPVEYVIVHERLITPGLIADLHDSGKKVFGWTINRKASMVRLASWGVDGIVSDKTELLVATVRPE